MPTEASGRGPGVGVVLLVAVLVAHGGCGARQEAAPPEMTTAAQPGPEPVELPEPTPTPAGLAPLLIETLTGDLDGMVERGVIRVDRALGLVHYFVDRGARTGITYDDDRRLRGGLKGGLGNRPSRPRHRVLPTRVDRLIRW